MVALVWSTLVGAFASTVDHIGRGLPADLLTVVVGVCDDGEARSSAQGAEATSEDHDVNLSM
jgi:hypothetical protein